MICFGVRLKKISVTWHGAKFKLYIGEVYLDKLLDKQRWLG